MKQGLSRHWTVGNENFDTRETENKCGWNIQLVQLAIWGKRFLKGATVLEALTLPVVSHSLKGGEKAKE